MGGSDGRGDCNPEKGCVDDLGEVLAEEPGEESPAQPAEPAEGAAERLDHAAAGEPADGGTEDAAACPAGETAASIAEENAGLAGENNTKQIA